MKHILTLAFIVLSISSYAQNNKPKLEIYAAPGLFFEHISSDSLVPPEKRNKARLGDVTSYAVQLAIPLKNERWLIKGGIGISTRHFSLSKYSLGDFFVSLLLFDAPLRRDSFALNYVRFTNNYFQIPVSVSYALTKPYHSFQVFAGLNIRTDFLTKSKAGIRFDSAFKIPDAADIASAQKTYTANATKLVFTAEPYLESAFKIYKSAGLFLQLRPFSFYSSPLDKHITVSTAELFSFTFGASYSLNK